MFVNDEERKKNENLVFAVLKKMVDSKELILTATNGLHYYKLSADPVLSGGAKDKDEAFHEKSSLPNLIAPDKYMYTNMIKSALKNLEKTERQNNRTRTVQFPTSKILE